MIGESDRKYVFVCGLHRSGTSVLARNIARLDGCTKFQDTGVLHDEGQYLQDVYPADAESGGPGGCGFDSKAHLTEASPLLTPENIGRLHAAWHSRWDPTKPICLEKTPSNIIMTRFLQAAFPNSYFIVIRRHPISVSLATQKWSRTSLHSLIEHWLRCYDLFEEDKRHLRHVFELTYENYITEPGKYHQAIAKFIGTRPPESHHFESLTAAHNQRYLDRWCRLLAESRFKGYYRYLVKRYERRVACFGYSLSSSSVFNGASTALGAPTAALGAIYCGAAEAYAKVWWQVVPAVVWAFIRSTRPYIPSQARYSLRRILRSKAMRWSGWLFSDNWTNKQVPPAAP